MDFEIIRKKFIEYSKKYDLKNINIMRKFHHSFRVMEYCKEIAKSLNLSNEDINLVMIIGLLHDIGRFEQWTKYNTYIDLNSIDHGDLSCDILNDLLEESKYKNIILTAVKNHNKLKIEANLDDKTLLFCKIIRDADKLDIIKEQNLIPKENLDKVPNRIIECFKNKKLVYDANGDIEATFRQLAFIYDIHFKHTYEVLLKNKIIENKINLLKIYISDEENIDYIFNSITNYINNKIQGE
ncbi:MAG: HD domain-containing protein [Firmicutes bacterium]|nr:HD domain-containing protein [Bacillota bacterium]